MYGRIFQRMYQGSMVGAGSTVFAVWGYCIANADPDNHTVDLNPALLAAVIGETKENIEKAISYLASEDLNSHNKSHDGRRLVNTTGYEYFLPSHEDYRKILNGEDLRQYFRTKKREQRAVSKTVKDIPGQSKTPASVYASSSVSGTEQEGGCKGDDEQAAYGEFKNVRLSPEEYAKLIAVHGQDKLTMGVDILGDYMAASGKKYKSHYAVLKKGSWVWNRVEEKTKSGTVKETDPTIISYADQWIHMRQAGFLLDCDVSAFFRKVTDNCGTDGVALVKEAAKQKQQGGEK